MGAYTGPFPDRDAKNPAAFRAAEIKRQGSGFKNAKAADTFATSNRLTDHTAMDPFPSLKSKDDTGAHGKTVHTKAGAMPTVQKKARPFTNYAPMTKPPQGRTLPVRGEHDS